MPNVVKISTRADSFTIRSTRWKSKKIFLSFSSLWNRMHENTRAASQQIALNMKEVMQ